MIKYLVLLIILAIVLVACGQKSELTSIKVSNESDKSNTVMNVKNSTISNFLQQKNVYSIFVYIDTIGKKITIENSYPRGGLKYTDFLGKEYAYAVFWTRITNTTENPLELFMNFSDESYQLPSSPDRLFKLFIPADTLTPEKESQFNYGLDLEKYLDSNLRKQSILERVILPNSFSSFYVVTLFNKGVIGTLRTGLKISNDKLWYQVNDKTIDCGQINLNLLKLKE